MAELNNKTEAAREFGPEVILRSLPHRYPFLFVDKVLEVEPGVRAVAIVRMTANTPYFSRAGRLEFPDVLIIEAMAQLGAVTAAATDDTASDADQPPVSGYLAAINDAVFKVRAVPGDTITLTLDYVARMGSMVRFNGTAIINGDVAATCGLTFTVEV
jgi:3-hydroxyacyl-[acyl-carrier-protein] dehydratase